MIRAPSLADIEALARAALESLPARFREPIEAVVIQVEEFPDAEVERDMGLESPFDLLGLYQGVSLDRKSVLDLGGDLDRVFLYRRPLLDYWCETGEDLADLVRHVLIHEIGHHLGFSDAEMEAIEGSSDDEADEPGAGTDAPRG